MLRIRVPKASIVLSAACLALAVTGCNSMVRSLGGPNEIAFGRSEKRVPEMAPAAAPQVECPAVTVRDGTETYSIYARGHEGDPQYVLLQGTISKTARECSLTSDGRIAMKLGIAGRLLLGPQGQAGTYELPLRAALLQRGGDVVWSELRKVPVTVPEGSPRAPFSHVAEGIVFDVPAGGVTSGYIVYVGFDEAGR